MNSTIALIISGAVGAIYIVVLGFLFLNYTGDKVQAAILLSGAVGIIYAQILNYHRSAGNAEQIAVVKKKVDTNTVTTEETHQLVNSRLTQLIAALEKAAMVQESLASERGKAEGITIGRAQVSATIDAVRSSDGPTTIAAAGPTTIEPAGPVTIVVKEVAP